jgi:YidC/Oxa1 family membrane protein insertase
VGPDNRRILFATVISMAILFGWQMFFAPKPEPKPEGAPVAGGPAAPAPAAGAPAAAPATPPPPPAAAPVPDAPEELVVLESDELRATFTSHGGALKSLVLKGEKFRKQEKEGATQPVDLVHVTEGQPLPLAVIPGAELGGTGTPAEDPAARAPMRVAARDARSVTFEGRAGALGLTKRFALTGKPYEIAVSVKAAGDRQGTLALVYPAYVSPDVEKPGFFSGGEIVQTVTPFCRAGGKTVRGGGDEAAKVLPGATSWVGLDQHYFVSALLPQAEGGECVLGRGARAGALYAALRLPFDRQLEAAFTLFAGPKQIDLLQTYERGLDSAIDYGPITNFFAFFARMLLWIMRQAYSLVHNWGIAIVLLTLLVKVALYPLTAKSMASMNEMRKLQPEIEKLKAKFGADREKMNLAVMQLYQQHKVNPLGGCLPLLLQMPIFFALYATLQTSVELYREPFLWIPDLTRYDPLYVLPLAMGISQFVMQKLSPQPADNTQAKMLLYFMPIFFTVIMFKLPAGLALYIFANNLISMAQQQWLMRRSNQQPPAGAAAA